MTTTLETLKQAVLSDAAREMERDPVPAFVAEMCAERAGKPITERHANLIRAKFPGLHVRLDKRYGMTQLRWYVDMRNLEHVATRDGQAEVDARRALRAAGVGDHESSVSLLVDWRVTHVVWPTIEDFTERNTWAFGARDTRNEERDATMAAVNSGDLSTSLAAVAGVIDSIAMMAQEIEGHLVGLPSAVQGEARAMVDRSLAKARAAGK